MVQIASGSRSSRGNKEPNNPRELFGATMAEDYSPLRIAFAAAAARPSRIVDSLQADLEEVLYEVEGRPVPVTLFDFPHMCTLETLQLGTPALVRNYPSPFSSNSSSASPASSSQLPSTLKPEHSLRFTKFSRTIKDEPLQSAQSEKKMKRSILPPSNHDLIGSPGPQCVLDGQPTLDDDDGVGGHMASNISLHCSSAGLTTLPYPLPANVQYLWVMLFYYSTSFDCFGRCIIPFPSSSLSLSLFLSPPYQDQIVGKVCLCVCFCVCVCLMMNLL